MRAFPCLLLAVALAGGAQDAPPVASEQVHVTAIDVVADVRDTKGNLPLNLKPADFVVIEDGVERTVVGLDYLRAERIAGAVNTTPAAETATLTSDQPLWQNVIYFETTLVNGRGRIAAAREMLKHVDTLVQMGTVDVVLANPSPVALVRNSRDAAAIRAALEKVASFSGINQLAAHRRNYLREVDNLTSLSTLKDGAGRPSTLGPMLDPINPRPFIDQEIAMISDFRQSLMAWLSFYRRQVPRNLLIVTDGFDLDPAEFYGATLGGPAKVELRSYVSQSTLAETANRMAALLAAGGWTAVSIPSDNNADGWVDDASVSAIGRVQAGTIGKRDTSPKAFLIRPLDPLNAIAEATGGRVVPNSGHLSGVLEGLDDRVRLTYQVDRKPDGKNRRIEIRARDASLKVRAPKFATSNTPDEIARTRAVELLKAGAYLGDLATEATVEWAATAGTTKRGTLRATTNVDLVKQLLPPGAKGQFRITLAVQVGKDPVVINRAVADYTFTGNVFRFSTPIEVPPEATVIVVVIEETTTGAWGSGRLGVS